MHRMQILADLRGLRDPHRPALDRGAEFDENLFLEPRGESAEFDFAAEFLLNASPSPIPAPV